MLRVMTPVSLREQHAEATRERILSAVAELLERGDAEELTVPGVAAASGVSLRTVYRYYPTREELLEETGMSGEEIGAAVGWAIRTLVDDLRKREEQAKGAT